MTAKIFICFQGTNLKGGKKRDNSNKVRSWKAVGQVINNMTDPRKGNPELTVRTAKQPNLHHRSLKGSGTGGFICLWKQEVKGQTRK